MAERSSAEDTSFERSQQAYLHSKNAGLHEHVQEPSHIPYPWDYSNEGVMYPSRTGQFKEAPHYVSSESCINDLKPPHSSKNANLEDRINNYQQEHDCNRTCSFQSHTSNLVQQNCLSGNDFSVLKYQNESEGIMPGVVAYDLQTQTSPMDDNNSSVDPILEKFTESPVSARIPSPSSVSSVTSGKRLEWDSGADVGYIYSHDAYPSSNENLSTIERLALVRGCSTALFKRLDPDGISGPPKPVPTIQNASVSFNSPVANSTPLSRNENISCGKVWQNIPEVEQVEASVLPGGFLYLHCDQEFENDVAPDQERNKCNEEKSSGANLQKKLSNSLIDLRTDQTENVVSSSLPRSQSFFNLSKDQYQTGIKDQFHLLQKPKSFAATCSVSSSVATIVQKPVTAMTSDKNVQTLPLKLSVGVQVCENSEGLLVTREETNTNYRDEAGGKNGNYSNKSQVNSLEKKSRHISKDNNAPKCDPFKCTGAHKKDSLNTVICASQNKQIPPLSFNFVQNVMSEVLSHVNNRENVMQVNSRKTHKVSDRDVTTSASGSSYSQTGESSSGLCVPLLEPSVLHDGVHSSTGVVGSANSFEYLPGEVFERSFPNSSETCRKSTPNSSSQTNSTPPIVKRNNIFQKTNRDSESSTLKKSVEEGVVLLKKLIAGKSMNTKMKKKLIQEIVNKLVDSDRNEEESPSHSDSVNSNKNSIVSADNTNAVITNVINKHLGSGDWAEESSRYIPNESSDRSLRESAVHSSELRSTTQCSEASKNQGLNSSCTPSGSISVPGDDEQSRAESSLFSSSNASKNSRQDWKIPTSRAEKIFQSKREETGESSSYTPPLLKLCKTEHVKQLEWIKFEINHLTHLKQLLEKQDGITKSLSKLTLHENKLHKLKKNCPKPSHNVKLERNNHEHSSSKNENKTNESSTPNSSGNAQEHTSRYPSILERREGGGKNSGNANKLESPTQSSYILSPSNMRSIKNGTAVHELRSRRGNLNVFTGTSANSEENTQQYSVEPGSYTKSDESKLQHIETAFKCCCECKRALEAIALRQKQNPTLSHQHVHRFCRCHFMGANPFPEEKSDEFSDDTSRREIREHVKRTEVTNIKCKFCNDQDNYCSSGCVHHTCPKTCPRHGKEYETTVSKSGSTMENKVAQSDAEVQASIKEPLAYMLTFEPSATDNKVKRNSLPEIKLVVPPCIHDKKKISLKKPVIATVDSDSYKENQCPKESKQDSEREEYVLPVQDIELGKRDHPQLDSKLSDQNQPILDEIKKSSKLTLQEYLKANRPDYIKLADKRSQCLADLAVLRDMRKKKRMELLRMTCIPESTEAKDTSDEKATGISERATVTSDKATVTSVSGKRLFSTRTIREQARRKYMKTKEVQSKMAERKKKEDSRANRLMVELFTKNLQKRALQGIVDHSYSASLSSAS